MIMIVCLYLNLAEIELYFPHIRDQNQSQLFADYSRQREKHANENVVHQSSSCICAIIIH